MHSTTTSSPVMTGVCAVVLLVLLAAACVLYHQNMTKSRKTMIMKQRLKCSVNVVQALLTSTLMDIDTKNVTGDQQRFLAMIEGLHKKENPESTDYFFILDNQGRSWASGRSTRIHKDTVFPEVVGKEMPNSEHVHPIESMVQLAQRGGGFVEYKWNHPIYSDEKRSKISYVQSIPGTPFLVGRGGYVDDL
jgi:signal transduction histidine kinase